MKTSFFMRLNTMLRPILDNFRFETFAFFVPYRTIWQNHEKFHGAQDMPADSIDFTIPTIQGVNNALTGVGSLWDFFGLPISLVPDDIVVSSLPFRAYDKIWSEWFRDENLQDTRTPAFDDGPDLMSAAANASAYVAANPWKRGKRKDYFTSCLPWPQKQTAGVSLPLGTTAPVTTVDGADLTGAAEPIHWGSAASGTLAVAGRNMGIMDGVAGDGASFADTLTSGDPLQPLNLIANLAGASAATINDIRLAFQTQRLLERDARSGTRYVEALKAHWGVTSPDFRLQRAEFLGGGSSVVNLSPVVQQNREATLGTPGERDKVGNLAANGIVSGTHSWNKSFVEHGVVIILGNIRGDITYSQGIDRYWGKQTRYEFFYPVLSGIGEQSVLNKEIWADASANDDLVFGYQERYAEYRFLNSKLTSLMRPDASGTLASWHLSEDFATLPALGDTFIQANTGVPLDRAIAVPSQPQFFADFYHEIRAARPLPTYGVPGNIDHF